jgi:membrane fusion protein (multidrug efflux system)
VTGRITFTALFSALVALAVGCEQPNAYVAPPPPPVTVAQPRVQSVTAYREETGRTEASDYVEVRARVKGFLKKIHFQPNEEVEQGQLLYEIEPDRYQAAVNQAVAAKTIAEATYGNALAQYERAVKLLESQAMAKEEVEQRRAEMEIAKAQIEAAQANIEAAQLDLEYTKITAPISGEIGKTEVFEGNLVGDGEATLLTKIVKYDPMFATFTVSEKDLLSVRDDIAKNPQARKDSRESIRLFLRRDIDNGFPFEGRVNFADLAVDPTTATYSVRGEFPNPDKRLVEGLFVRIRLPVARHENALLIPQRAVGSDPVGSYVFAVDSENTVSRKDVTLSTRLGSLVVIDSGLTAEDHIIIDGLQRAQIDKKVEPNDGEIPEAKDLWAPPPDTKSESDAS